MKILDRYLIRDMIVPFCIGQGAVVMMLTGTVLYNNAELFLANQVPFADVARLVLYFLPFLIHMTMPVAMAVAASLSVSRLARDSEITVMRASGVSLVRIFMPIFLIGLLFSVGDFFWGEYVVPASMARYSGVLAEMPLHLKKLIPQSGQFIVSNDQSFALYVKTMIPHKGEIELRGVQIIASPNAIYSGASEPFIVTAKEGVYKSGGWTLFRPFMIRYSLDDRRWETAAPQTFTYFTPVDPQVFQKSFFVQMPMGTMANNSTRTFSQLGVDIARERKQGLIDPYAVLDYHFKLSVPFSCLVMALCCPPLALRFARGGGFMGVLLSICLVFVYWNTLLLSRILGSPGPEGMGAPLTFVLAPLLRPFGWAAHAAALTAPVAAWSQNVLFALTGLVVLRRSE